MQEHGTMRMVWKVGMAVGQEHPAFLKKVRRART